MNRVKEEAIQLIKKLPDDCTVQDILYELYVKQKVDEGLQDLKQGKTLSQGEVKRRAATWGK